MTLCSFLSGLSACGNTQELTKRLAKSLRVEHSTDQGRIGYPCEDSSCTIAPIYSRSTKNPMAVEMVNPTGFDVWIDKKLLNTKTKFFKR